MEKFEKEILLAIKSKNIFESKNFLKNSYFILEEIFKNINNKMELKLTKKILEILKRLSNKDEIEINLELLNIYNLILSNDNNYIFTINEKIENSILIINNIINILTIFKNFIYNENIFLLKKRLINYIKFIYVNYRKLIQINLIDILNDIKSKFFSENYNNFFNDNKILNDNINLENIENILINTFNYYEQIDIINYILNNNNFYEKLNDEQLSSLSKLLFKYNYNIINIINEENNNNNNNFEEEKKNYEDDDDYNTFLIIDANIKTKTEIESDFLYNKKFKLNLPKIKNKKFKEFISKKKDFFHEFNENIKIININNFNLPYGFNKQILVKNSCIKYFYINNYKNNTLFNIEFEIDKNFRYEYDIILNIYKYKGFNENENNKDNIDDNNEENKEKFIEMFKSEKLEKKSKIILFCQTPGIYKIEFNNYYSWINEKKINLKMFEFECIEKELYLINNKYITKENLYCFYNNENCHFDMKKIFEEIENNNNNDNNNNNNNKIEINILIFENKIRIINNDKLILYEDKNNELITNDFFDNNIKDYISNNNIQNDNNNLEIIFFNLNNNLIENFPKISEKIQFLEKLLNESENNNNENTNKIINEINTISQIGFFPKNFEYTIYNISDSLLFYYFFYSLKNSIHLDLTIALLNIDKYSLNISIFNDGNIYNKLKDFNYKNKDKNQINDLIKKLNENFNGFDLIITNTDLKDNNNNNNYEKEYNDIINIIKNEKYEPKINIYFYDNIFFNDMIKYIKIFYKYKKTFEINKNNNNEIDNTEEED